MESIKEEIMLRDRLELELTEESLDHGEEEMEDMHHGNGDKLSDKNGSMGSNGFIMQTESNNDTDWEEDYRPRH
jgi:hypothetical protein